MNLFHATMYRFRFNTGWKVLMAITMILAFFLLFISQLDNQMYERVLTTTDFFRGSIGDFKLIFFILAGCFSGFLIGNDFSDRTLQCAIAQGHSRMKLVITTTISYVLMILPIPLLFLLINTLGYSLLTDQMAELGSHLSYFIVTAVGYAFLASACATVNIFFAFLMKRKGTIIAVNMLLLVLVDQIFQFVAGQLAFLRPIYTSSLFNEISAFPYVDFDPLTIASALIQPLCWMVIVILVTNLLFRRMELQ